MKDDKGHGSDGRGGGVPLDKAVGMIQKSQMAGLAGRGSAMDRAIAAIKQEFGGQRHPAEVAAQHGIQTSHLGPSTGNMHQDIANAVAHGMSKWK